MPTPPLQTRSLNAKRFAAFRRNRRAWASLWALAALAAASLAAGLLCCPDWPALLHARGKRLAASRLAQSRLLPLLASGGLLLLSLCFLIGQTYNPFLYFRF